MTGLIYQWIDLLWLPVGWFAVHPQHRWKTMALIFACIFTMRTQVELITMTGYPTGYLPLMDSALYPRGLIVYSVIMALFLVLAHFSRRTKRIVFMAVAITVYFFAFTVSTIFMVL